MRRLYHLMGMETSTAQIREHDFTADCGMQIMIAADIKYMARYSCFNWRETSFCMQFGSVYLEYILSLSGVNVTLHFTFQMQHIIGRSDGAYKVTQIIFLCFTFACSVENRLAQLFILFLHFLLFYFYIFLIYIFSHAFITKLGVLS